MIYEEKDCVHKEVFSKMTLVWVEAGNRLILFKWNIFCEKLSFCETTAR
ncbi:MAG: hypothetical protein H6P94_313 [Thermoplasmatales archaeon]|nr:hypothetical protein [Thermoplasmatales archaeon]